MKNEKKTNHTPEKNMREREREREKKKKKKKKKTTEEIEN